MSVLCRKMNKHVQHDQCDPMSNDSENEMLLPHEKHSHRKLFIGLEFIMVLYYTSYFISLPIEQFYIYSRAAEKYHVVDIMEKLGNISECKGHVHNSLHTGNETNVMDLIQQETSELFLYLGFASCFPAVLSNLFLGNLGDRIGRKRVLIVTLMGCFIREIIYAIVITLGIRVEYLFIGNAIEGATGFFGAATASAYSIIADITPAGKDRATRATVFEATVALTFGVGCVGTGYWLEVSPFYIPVCVSSGICFIAILATIIILPVKSITHTTENPPIRPLVSCPKVLCDETAVISRRIVLAGVICNSISVAVVIGKSNFQTLFLINKPLCWTEVKVMLFSALSVVGSWMVSLVTLNSLQSRVHDIGVAILGAVSGVVSLSIMAFSKTDWMVYLSTGVGVYMFAIIPMQKSVMSRLVAGDQQGSLFGNLASLEMLMTALSGILYSEVYTATEAYFPGLMYLVMSAMMGVIMIISILMKIGLKDKPQHPETDILVYPDT